MNPFAFGVAAGALTMYFLDPQAGRRRRARARDKAERSARQLRDAYDVTLRDVRQRGAGLRAASRHLLRREQVSDEALHGRVRSVLGRYVSHPHAVEVAVSEGRVTLSGPVLEREMGGLAAAVRHVGGVKGVENRLVPHKEAGNVSALQGGVPRRGRRFELMQETWSPAARLAIGGLGLALFARGGVVGRVAGLALLARAVSNLEFAPLVGLGAPEDGIEVHKTICVNAPVEQVFAFWSDYQNFPRFMSNVREVRVSGSRSHWVVNGPAGVPVEWTSELVREEPNAALAWRSTADSAVKQEGEVLFEPTADGGTRVGVRLCYLPPAGAFGHVLATLFGADPKSEMDADLMRMKSMIESGHAPHDAAQRAA